MMMVVGLHYLHGGMGGALDAIGPSQPNYYIVFIMESLFIVGVNCFVLITGYFQISKETIKINNVIRLIVMMLFYGAVIYTVALLLNWTTFSFLGLIETLAPILFGFKWFIQAYLVLYLLIPFINVGLNTFDKSKYKMFLLISFLLFSFYPSFVPSPPVTDYGYGIINFVFLYSIGGYLKKHYEADKTKRFYFGGYFICAIITTVFAFAVKSILGGGLGIVWGYNFVFNIFGSVFLFLAFSKLEIQSKIINYISKFTLGVYFVHTYPITYDFIYRKVLNTHLFWYSPLFIIHVLISVLIVYFIATIIDIGRSLLFNKVGQIISPFTNKYKSVFFKSFP